MDRSAPATSPLSPHSLPLSWHQEVPSAPHCKEPVAPFSTSATPSSLCPAPLPPLSLSPDFTAVIGQSAMSPSCPRKAPGTPPLPMQQWHLPAEWRRSWQTNPRWLGLPPAHQTETAPQKSTGVQPAAGLFLEGAAPSGSGSTCPPSGGVPVASQSGYGRLEPHTLLAAVLHSLRCSSLALESSDGPGATAGPVLERSDRHEATARRETWPPNLAMGCVSASEAAASGRTSGVPAAVLGSVRAKQRASTVQCQVSRVVDSGRGNSREEPLQSTVASDTQPDKKARSTQSTLSSEPPPAAGSMAVSVPCQEGKKRSADASGELRLGTRRRISAQHLCVHNSANLLQHAQKATQCHETLEQLHQQPRSPSQHHTVNSARQEASAPQRSFMGGTGSWLSGGRIAASGASTLFELLNSAPPNASVSSAWQRSKTAGREGPTRAINKQHKAIHNRGNPRIVPCFLSQHNLGCTEDLRIVPLQNALVATQPQTMQAEPQAMLTEALHPPIPLGVSAGLCSDEAREECTLSDLHLGEEGGRKLCKTPPVLFGVPLVPDIRQVQHS